jgi:hypothetical protein
MKKKLIAILLCAGSIPAFAQDANVKEKKALLTEDAELVYHVADNKSKTGPFYIKRQKNDQVLLKGAYTDNKRSGNWYFYNEKGSLESVYSYQQNKLAFIDSALFSKMQVIIPDQPKEVSENASIPVLVSPMNLFLTEISESMKIPADHFDGTNPLTIHIRTQINAKGDPTYSVIYDLNGKKIAVPVRLKKNAFEIEWIPSRYNNQSLKSELIITTNINPPQENGHSRFIWNY